MKKTIKNVIIGLLAAGTVLSVSAYSTQIWSPVQFVKQLFVTPNGETDMSKATIKIDGTNGEIDAKKVVVNGSEVITDKEIPTCSTNKVLTKRNGKFICVDASSIKQRLDGKCSNVNNQCLQGVTYDIGDTSSYYRWQCKGLNGGKVVTCSKHKPVNGVCGVKTYTCVVGKVVNKKSTDSYVEWKCEGLYGGKSSVLCKVNKCVTSCNASNVGKKRCGYNKVCSYGYTSHSSCVSYGTIKVPHTSTKCIGYVTKCGGSEGVNIDVGTYVGNHRRCRSECKGYKSVTTYSTRSTCKKYSSRTSRYYYWK